MGGIRCDKQSTQLGPIGEELSCIIDCEWQVEAALPPVGYAIGKFRRALQALVRCEAPRKFRLALSNWRIIQMLFYGPLSDISNLSVVDLDLVMNLTSSQDKSARTKPKL